MLLVCALCALASSAGRTVEWMDKRVDDGVWLKLFVSHPVPYDDETPLVLLLSGGMGTPMISLMHPMEPHLADYIVVAPEQRGVWGINGTAPSASLDEHADDHARVLEYATSRFNRKAFVWGISFGGVYALHLADRRPALIAALLMTGPVTVNVSKAEANATFRGEIEQYVRTVGRRITCDEILERIPWFLYPLKWLGCPDDNSTNYWFTIFYFTQFAAKLGLTTRCERRTPFCDPDLTPDALSLIRSPLVGWTDTVRLALSNVNYHIMNNVPVKDIVWRGTRVAVPVYVIGSRADKIVPAFLLEDFLNELQAPRVEARWLDDAGHMMFADSRDEHFALLREFIDAERLAGSCAGAADAAALGPRE